MRSNASDAITNRAFAVAQHRGHPTVFDVEVTVLVQPREKSLSGSRRTRRRRRLHFQHVRVQSELQDEEKRVDRRVSAALELIHSNLHQRVSIAELARAVNLSRWRFCHLFKTEMSISPSVYIGTLRMLKAEKMLGETFLSVKEIRAELGNLDRTHFSRAFKKFCGLTPAQFRRRRAGDIHKSATQYSAM